MAVKNHQFRAGRKSESNGVVGRSVVDENHLFGRVALSPDGSQTTTDAGRFVAGNDDDAGGRSYHVGSR